MSAQTLHVRRRVDPPLFSVRGWASKDDATPLRIALGQADALVWLKTQQVRPGLIVWVECEIELVFASPPPQLIRGLRARGAASKEAAQTLFELFALAFERFEALLMTAGGVRNLLVSSRPRIENFFREDSTFDRNTVRWRLDDGGWEDFKPPVSQRSRRNPLFKSDQLLTPQKWVRMQRASDRGDIPQDEVLELLRIRARAAFDEKPISLVEAAIVAEAITRDFCIAVLEQRGFSQNRLKTLRQDLTFNLLLNAILPLALSKSEMRRIATASAQVDRLRKLRNDLVHENSRDAESDAQAVRKGLDGAVRLVDFLRSRTPK